MEYMKFIKAEIVKQQKNYTRGIGNKISIVIWPLLIMIANMYTYFSFDIYNYIEENNMEILIFFESGILVYNCFWNAVQGAFYLTRERQNGTLEMVMLAPSKMSAHMYGRAVAGVTQNILFMIILITMIIYTSGCNKESVFKCIAVVSIISFTAIIWGGFVNSLFMISRDTRFLFALFDEPMYLFSGAKIPLNILPTWITFISMLFPISFCMEIIRTIIYIGEIRVRTVICLAIAILVIIAITLLILTYAERHNRKLGNITLY